ncbi:MAG: YdcF-like protein, partial [uncultured Microvirga sp.]
DHASACLPSASLRARLRDLRGPASGGGGRPAHRRDRGADGRSQAARARSRADGARPRRPDAGLGRRSFGSADRPLAALQRQTGDVRLLHRSRARGSRHPLQRGG